MMQSPSTVIEHLRGNAGRRAAPTYDDVQIVIDNLTGQTTVAFQHANYIEVVATGTPTAGRDPLSAYAAPAVSFAAGNRVILAHQLKLFVRRFRGERTVAALVKRPEGWVVKKAADIKGPVVVIRNVRRFRDLSFKDENQATFLGSKSSKFLKIWLLDFDKASIVLTSSVDHGQEQASQQMPSRADHISVPLDQ
ncbi:unnamed protein product (mitochondrion) [Plasmodiophora brassicae]|uniref:Uncharacterized protein n=1 Tax=Plasmodiophora brassicae TaxID=37360 RepID=A0A3P3YKJ7_PLABS|nr:unnamed protein product [Plasmodiophora brassicae]